MRSRLQWTVWSVCLRDNRDIFQLSRAFESLSGWSDSFYFEIDTGDCWPKTNANKDNPRGLLKLVFLVWTREKMREVAGGIGTLQWNQCRFSGLENEYVELDEIHVRRR